MSDSFRTSPPDQQWSANQGGNGHQRADSNPDADSDDDSGELGKALVVGVLGGLLAVAGYMVYRRLPDEQKDKLHTQVRHVVAQRISELRENLNI